MTTEKVYKVVRILSEDSLAINAGLNDNFYEGDQVEVYVEGEELIDPDTELSLGKLYFIKAKLEVTYSTPSYSICQNIYEKTEPGLSKWEKILDTPPPITKKYVKKLNVFNDQITGYGIPEKDVTKSILVGDIVRKI